MIRIWILGHTGCVHQQSLSRQCIHASYWPHVSELGVVGLVLHYLDQVRPIMWPGVCHLDLPIRNLCRYLKTLSIAYKIIDMVMADQSDYFRLITTTPACYSSLGNPHTIISTGFCFTYSPFSTIWQFPIFSTSNK